MADLPIIHRLIASRCITLFDMFLFLLAVVFFSALLVKGNWIRVCFFSSFLFGRVKVWNPPPTTGVLYLEEEARL